MLTSERVEVPQSAYDVNEEMYERGWTDGLPVIPPTDDLVHAFIEETGRDAGEIVAEIPPDNGEATIEIIAINAVMAGCKPEYMPVLLAAIEAVMEPRFNLGAIQVTTNPATPMLIINGSIRNQLGVNCKTNALGPGCRANATIGRALNLILRNVGGALPGTVCKSTLGQPGRYTMCLGENEEESPWEPLHVERGLQCDQSAVTVVGACGTVNAIMERRDYTRMLPILGRSMAILGDTGMIRLPCGEALVIMSPPHAKIMAEAGLSKPDVKRILWEHGRLPIDWFPADAAARKRDEGAVIDGMALAVQKPEDITLIVAGGPVSSHSVYIPNFGSASYSVTKPIKL